MSEEENKQQEVVAAAETAETKAEAKPSQPSASDLLSADVGEIKVRKAKGSKNVYSGVCHINATFNNTKVAFTDQQGNVISQTPDGGSSLEPGKTVSQVAYDLGFQYSQHFNRVFKKNVGCTPNEYRKRQLSAV